MKKIALALVCIICLSCTNTNTVNILITNRSGKDLSNKEIAVSVSDIRERLQTTEEDTLIVMNEKNIQIVYHYDNDSSNIIFVVPLLRKNSQKTYSVNRSHSRLSENLLKFRSENIMIDVR
ncbi:MAG: hypothetical protein ACI4V5_00990 [Prevotella sp.]